MDGFFDIYPVGHGLNCVLLSHADSDHIPIPINSEFRKIVVPDIVEHNKVIALFNKYGISRRFDVDVEIINATSINVEVIEMHHRRIYRDWRGTLSDKGTRLTYGYYIKQRGDGMLIIPESNKPIDDIIQSYGARLVIEENPRIHYWGTPKTVILGIILPVNNKDVLPEEFSILTKRVSKIVEKSYRHWKITLIPKVLTSLLEYTRRGAKKR